MMPTSEARAKWHSLVEAGEIVIHRTKEHEFSRLIETQLDGAGNQLKRRGN